jgi:restriction system protein
MGLISNWIAAILAVAIVGTAGTAYFRTHRMRREETAAGLVALSGISWRAFVRMVLDALERRGYGRPVEQEDDTGDRDFMLEKDGRHWLLSCKHGSAYVLGRPVINQLANDILLKNAAGGILVTQGRIDSDARALAATQDIELLNGEALWLELRDALPPQQLAAIRAKATLLSWLAALVAGIAVFTLLPDRPRSEAAPAARVVESSTSPVAEAAPQPLTPPSLPIEEQRVQLRAAISTLPEVDRAVWSSESTLQVFLLAVDGDAFERICPLVERFDELASSRIQLTPPAGSDAHVRFKQCRSY